MSKIKGKYIQYDSNTLDLTGDELKVKDSVFVTYTGASVDVNLGSKNLNTSGTITAWRLSGVLSSTVTGTTQTEGDDSTKIATTEYVDTAVDVATLFLPEEISSEFTIPAGKRFVNFECFEVETDLIIEGTLMMEI